jgi:hypothetical protein
MKRILIVSILLTFIVSFGVSARAPRWNALGGEHRFIIDEDTEDVTEVVGQRSSTSVDCYYNMGLRTAFRGLVMDIILARNIVHRGPYFLTGGTGNWATEVCVTYEF